MNIPYFRYAMDNIGMSASTMVQFEFKYVTWTSWHLKSQSTWLFVLQLMHDNIKENIKILQY